MKEGLEDDEDYTLDSGALADGEDSYYEAGTTAAEDINTPTDQE